MTRSTHGWLPLVVAAFTLMACADTGDEQMEDTDAGTEMEAQTPAPAPAAEPQIDESSTDLATWNSDADARLAPSEFDAWLNDRDFYSHWDANADGSLDADEVSAGAPEGTDTAAWDTNGDGAIDRDEFNAGVFGAWDANGDGFIDETEWGANFDAWS